MRNIVFFDVETTGLDFDSDRVVQLSAVKATPDLEEVDQFSAFICPSGEWHMSPGALKLTNYTEEFIRAVGKPLRDIGPSFLKFIEGCDLAGYNSNGFDIRMLCTDLAREGLELSVHERVCYDVYAMERRIHPTNLGAVFQRYTGTTMTESGLDAHEALSDAKATLEVFRHQLREKRTLEEVAEWEENHPLSADGMIKRTPEGRIVPTIGKYKTRDVFEISMTDPRYLKWWAQNILSKESFGVVREYLIKCYDNVSPKKSNK